MKVTVLVPSLSDESVSYPVTRDADVLVCECVRYLMTKSHECSHTELVRRADKILERCAEQHGLESPGRLCRQCLVSLLALSMRHVRKRYMLKTDAKEKIAAARKKRTRKKKGGADEPVSNDETSGDSK